MSPNWERPPIAGSSISVIVTARQAEKTLTPVVEALVGELEKLRRDFEVLITDSGSNDATRMAAQGLAAAHPKVLLVSPSSKPGYGAALRAAITAARHPLVFTLPGDGSYPASVLPDLLAAMDSADIVLGHRWSRSWWRTQWEGWKAYLGFGLWLKDVTCPVRLYRREVLAPIPIQSKSRFAEVEILAKANFRECIFTEVPVPWQPGAGVEEASSFADALLVFRNPDFGPGPPAPAVAGAPSRT